MHHGVLVAAHNLAGDTMWLTSNCADTLLEQRIDQCLGTQAHLAGDTMRLPRVSSPTGELSTDTLTQQLARMTPQRLAPNRLPLQQSAPWTPQRLEVERTEVPEHGDNHHEALNQGGRRQL